MTKPQARPARRSPWPMIAGVGVLAILAAALAFVLLTRRASLVPPSSPSPTPVPTLNADMLSHRLTVLVIGLDSDERRRKLEKGVNSDAIMVASITADQSAVTLVSLPRDTVDIPMPDGSTWQQKVNAIYSQQGAEGLAGAVGELLQIQIDNYVQIDMGDLADMVGAIGGVRVRVKQPLVDAHLDLDLASGRQLLDGETAEDYVRSRYTTNDFARAGRQQQVLLQIVKKLVSPTANVDIQAVLDSLHSFKTNLPLNDMPTLIELARRAQKARVTAQVLDPDHGFMSFAGDRGDGRGYVLEPNVDAMRQFAAEHLQD
jgi:LCP family protein required for cell wall assembly